MDALFVIIVALKALGVLTLAAMIMAAGVAVYQVLRVLGATKFKWLVYVLGEGTDKLVDMEAAVAFVGRGRILAGTAFIWPLRGFFSKIPLIRMAGIERAQWAEVMKRFDGNALASYNAFAAKAASMEKCRLRNCCILWWEVPRGSQKADVLVFLGDSFDHRDNALETGVSRAERFCSLVKERVEAIRGSVL